MIFLQSITLTNSPALRGHGDGLQDLDRLNAFFFFGSRKSRHGGLTDTRNFFGLIRIVADIDCHVKESISANFCIFVIIFSHFFLIIFIFKRQKVLIFFNTDGQEFWSWVFSKELLCYFYFVCCDCSAGYFMYTSIRARQPCTTTRLKKRESNQRKKYKTGSSNDATAQAWLSSATSTISCCI